MTGICILMIMITNTHFRILEMYYNVFTLTIRKNIKIYTFFKLITQYWGLGLQVVKNYNYNVSLSCE